MSVVLIPAYEPDERLVALVRELRGMPVVVVDDGSGPAYRSVFAAVAASGALVLAHDRNRGKGAALRTGFAHIARSMPDSCVVTADADGQHTPADIARVAARIAPSRIVLGVRAFTGRVPTRSRIGNGVSRIAFRLASGRTVADTQTGLRGVAADALGWLQSVRGDRFEYEFRVLLQAGAAGFDLVEQPIATIYTDNNASSHFRPVRDSLRVYAPVVRFAASALSAFVIDTLALLVLHAMTGSLLFSVVAARVLSSTVNFAVNRRLVFHRGRDVALRAAAMRYFSLALLLLAANYGTISALSELGLPLLAAKVITEATLFLVSYGVQRAVVFAPASGPAPPRAADPAAVHAGPAVGPGHR
ncbi:glycosyltransferase [Microbacterium protaetiae]|uniref:Glycosyltransferase n=1 Tax=Microbacterium protaetiae TaxID=2509458 RepID=A0A4P6EG44_9MICO|nr:bifunctional glycosyltransferase family 2/GtrA family protein [Microbacterium protaetiae]QAY60393.1 glycosyltransferase [Microbacterium protaetiae]